MPALKTFFICYVIDTYDTTEVEKACNAAKAKTPLEYAKLQVDHLAKVFDDKVKEVIKDNPNDFKDNAKSLIVCAAPEFFFKDRKGEPYNNSDFFALMEYMKTKMPARDDVMILPGTIWWWTSSNKNPLDWKTTKPTIHNTLPVLVNKKYTHTWQKENLSKIDGLWPDVQEWDRDNKAVKAILDKTQVPVFEHTADGVTISIGLEICLDHHLAVLKSKAPKDLDIHILIACGMPANANNIAAKDGGVFIRCDGSIGKTNYISGINYNQRNGGKWELPKPVKGDQISNGGMVWVTDGYTIQVT